MKGKKRPTADELEQAMSNYGGELLAAAKLVLGSIGGESGLGCWFCENVSWYGTGHGCREGKALVSAIKKVDL